MIYLESFEFPSPIQEAEFFTWNSKARMTCYASKYPFLLFRERKFPEFVMKDITVFCGNNGSGKSTILNVIAEKLELERSAPYNKTDYFGDFTQMCDFRVARTIPPESRIITSDGVFENVLNIRRLNDGIDDKRKEMMEEYIKNRSSNDPETIRLSGLDDFDRWKKVSEARRKNGTASRYLKKKLIRNVQERSNGETALAFFVDSIEDNALYLLDEPENSLSPSNQLELKYFIEDSVRNHGCQFVISTHSPFLLSLLHAKIYDIDVVPPKVSRWTELECVRVYHDFFGEHETEFPRE